MKTWKKINEWKQRRTKRSVILSYYKPEQEEEVERRMRSERKKDTEKIQHNKYSSFYTSKMWKW